MHRRLSRILHGQIAIADRGGSQSDERDGPAAVAGQSADLLSADCFRNPDELVAKEREYAKRESERQASGHESVEECVNNA